ncbi:polymorphic toxin type 15 domain-containing protein [Xenorhabdus siamensis]|uniref:polymorphic toxin type 15 domain-containing protein n=1 Tax=Xenorhabdus siamensis TaxID=3136254 RepID=UPI0030F38806
MAKIKKIPPKPARDEALWKKRIHNDVPTGEGNTLGEITGQPPKSTQVPKKANPVIKPNTQDEGGFLNGLAKIGNAVVDAGKAVGNAAIGVGTGIAKNLGNTAMDVGELAWKGVQYAAAAEMEHAAMMQGAWGNEADSKQLRDAANAVRENASNTNWERYTMGGSAEEFGDFIADFNPKGLIKGAIKGGTKVISKITAKGGAKATTKAGKKIERNTSNHQKSKEDLEKLKKDLTEKREAKNGGKVKGVKKTKVPCFSPYNSKRYKKLKTEKERQAFLKEYADQLRRQQDAINNMSPSEFKTARDAYKKNKRNSKAASAQEDFRNDTERDISDKIYRGLIRKGKDPSEAKEIANVKAKEALQGLAALHEPDMVAGGFGQYAPKKMGDSKINSAIGGSWSGKRIKSLDSGAKDAVDSGLGDAKMNVQLELCRGKGKK